MNLFCCNFIRKNHMASSVIRKKLDDADAPKDLSESRKSSSNLYDSFLIELFNRLYFPSVNKEYQFKPEDLLEYSWITSTSRHVFKLFKHQPTQIIMAVKYVNIPRSQFEDDENMYAMKALKRELEVLSVVKDCPSIVYHYGTCLHEGQLLLCMESMDMSLHDYYNILHRGLGMFPEELIGLIAIKIVDALVFINTRGILHRNVKPTNILMNKNGTIKLCDFRDTFISKRYEMLASTYVGSFYHCPPEFVKNGMTSYDDRSDVWCLGISLFEAIQGRIPYLTSINERVDFTIIQLLCDTNFQELIENTLRNKCSNELCDFLSHCMESLDKRPHSKRLPSEPFYERYSKADQATISEVFKKYEELRNSDLSDGSNLSFLSKNLKLSPPNEPIKPFYETLHTTTPLPLTKELELRKCQIIFHDDHKEYDFHQMETNETIKTTWNVVQECTQLEAKRKIAVKTINIPMSKYPTENEKVQAKKLLQEIQTHLTLLHAPNIVSLYGFCICDGVRLKLAIELMEMNIEDLYRLVHEKYSSFPEDLFSCVGISVIDALTVCMHNNIIHRDIKPSNVLVDKNGKIKLCDFGESRALKDEEFFRTNTGTVFYLAPERLKDVPYDIRADIWSFGIMLVEIVYGKIPYQDIDGKKPNNIFVIHQCISNANAEEIINRCIRHRTMVQEIEELVSLCLGPLESRPSKYDMLRDTSFYSKFVSNVKEKIVVDMLKNLGVL